MNGAGSRMKGTRTSNEGSSASYFLPELVWKGVFQKSLLKRAREPLTSTLALFLNCIPLLASPLRPSDHAHSAE